MRILLDTNALLWQLGMAGGGRLGVQAKQILKTAEAVYVSAVTVVEMQIKTMNGRLDAPLDCVNMVRKAGDELISLSAEAADKLRNFPGLTKHDPFDRMLLAQAAAEQLTLLTADETLLGLGLNYVVDARA